MKSIAARLQRSESVASFSSKEGFRTLKLIDEMRRADGLLLFQGAQCNRQIPAKAYEYLASRRPIIGLIDSVGRYT